MAAIELTFGTGMSRAFLSEILKNGSKPGRLLIRSDVALKSTKVERTLGEFCEALLFRRVEASRMAIARAILDRYACWYRQC
jgi:hypothetical protein